MVDFKKRVYNTDKFRGAALYFKEHGCYTQAPRGTTDYVKYWERETKRCLEGFVADDGDPISGYHYFYLNYFPILRLVETKYTDKYGNQKTKFVRETEFADFYDYDYYFFNAVEQAEELGKHMAVLKARGRGYSFKAASMLVRNYELIPNSQNFAVASEQSFLTNDGILTKAWAGMDFIDKHTAWAKQRLVDTKLKRTSGFKITDEFGKQIEDGYKSSVIGITTKNNPDRIRGIRGRLIVWEEAGKFKDILQAWQIARPSVEDTGGNAFGTMLAFGTGGSTGSDFVGLKEMFYHPSGYNIDSYDNIWDDNAQDQKCAFFCPAWSNVTAIDKQTNQRICMDVDGNSLREKAVQFCIDKRKEVQDGASEQITVDRYVAENPLTPQESILEIGGNIFPKKLLMQQLAKIRTNVKLQNMKHIVDLAWGGDGKVIATEKKTGDITQYPLPKEKKPHGSIVIWEYPITDPPYGLYIGGCLAPGEKVCTQRGLVNVEDVTLDDKLLNKDGRFVEIKNLQRYEKVDEPIYTIKPYGTCRTTAFTGEHPIWVHNKGFVKAKDLKEGDWLEIPNVYSSEMGVLDNKLLKLYYFYGLWLGGGFCNKDDNSYDICLSVGKDEEELVQFYDSLMLELFGKTCVHADEGGEQTIRFTDKELCLKLKTMFGTNACDKRIPESIKRLPENHKRAFLQGYLDSNGSVSFNNGKVRVNFTSVNLELLEDVQDMLFGMNIANSIAIYQQSYRINVSRSDQYWLKYGPVFRSRKIKLLEKSFATSSSKMGIKFKDDKILLKVENIKQSSYTGTVYNFECDTHTFMCRNILTHNCDPYDHDDSFTNSLGSTFIYKRFKAGEAWTDVIVAEYSGRPDTAEEYYENVRKLLTFYNAKLLFENERKGIYPYFTNKHCDYLLADQPDKVISEVFKDSKVQRRKGCHMTKSIRQYGEGLIKEWLEEEYEPGHPNLERIYSEPLIEELIANNGERNVDRVIALCMVMIYREELYQIRVKDAKEQNKKVELFDMPLFSAQWWQAEDDSGVQGDIPTFYV